MAVVVVNPLWLGEDCNRQDGERLAEYSFRLQGRNFLVFGRASRNGKIEAEVEFWR